ncbi:putative Oxidoreductase, alcohol dehydrogenase-like protein [Nitrospira sp. KM1]|uniref:bi-domain-containing oxidoreductase n=1 Tax=Nitrospira sp. KM1 TaxID=1936990 RepID=UPI0013A71606|nr:bi-domain-containing oxidoreductase [Nitrospira sp. KM1]BCA57128.1 putative Oxidoreductase, alcohol dehydrogenase-like protein [Nitrospira sp. KM1]
MKQVIQHFRTGVLSVESVPAPTISDGEILVANRVSLISPGTERATVQVAKKSLIGKALDRPQEVRKVVAALQKDGLLATFHRVLDRLDTPGALGYSSAGVVLAVGKHVQGLSVGDRVACAGQNYASHAEIISVPTHLCVKLPDGIAFEDAAFVTLGAIALQGVRQAKPSLGERIAVIGLGLLGQLTVQLLKACGCVVLASDPDVSRRNLAHELGADVIPSPQDLIEASRAFSRGVGMDAVIITASTASNEPVETAGEISRQKGRVIVVGAVGMTLPREPYYKKELDFRLSMSYGPGRYDKQYEERGHDYPIGYVRWTEQRNMEAVLDLLGQGKVNTSKLVTDRYPIERAEEAYDRLKAGAASPMAVLLFYAGETADGSSRMVCRAIRKAGAVSLGIIGAGQHVRDMLLPQLTAIRNVSIAAICTGSGITAKLIAEKYEAGYCTTDFRAILGDETVNSVLIGTRHDSHADITLEALHAGKHVFVEKPLCITESELERIAEHWERAAAEGLQLWVGFNRRFSSHATKIIEFFNGRRNPLVMIYRVNAGTIAPTHWIQDPSIGGGRIIGEACHFIDFMQAVCGARPISIHAVRIASHTSGISEDQTILSMTFKDGSIGTLVYTAGGDAAIPKERFEAFGDGKAVILDDFTTTEFWEGGTKKRHKTAVRDKGFQEEMRQFTEAVVGAGRSGPTFEEIYAVTRTCLLALSAQKTGAVYDV